MVLWRIFVRQCYHAGLLDAVTDRSSLPSARTRRCFSRSNGEAMLKTKFQENVTTKAQVKPLGEPKSTATEDSQVWTIWTVEQ